jgi:hypothetical protein
MKQSVTLRFLLDGHQKLGESSQSTTIVNSVEETRTHFCKDLDGNPLFSALYGMYTVRLNGMYTVTLNELNAVLKMSAQT